MSIQLKIPSLGESIQEATIGAWLKKEGDAVQVDEPLVEVESEKATVALCRWAATPCCRSRSTIPRACAR